MYDHPTPGDHKGPLPTSAPPPPLRDPSRLPSDLNSGNADTVA